MARTDRRFKILMNQSLGMYYIYILHMCRIMIIQVIIANPHCFDLIIDFNYEFCSIPI